MTVTRARSRPRPLAMHDGVVSHDRQRWGLILAGGEGVRLADVLAMRPSNLAVLPVCGVEWSDWGQPRRVLSTLATLGIPAKDEEGSGWNQDRAPQLK
jgi:hypothetical protein